MKIAILHHNDSDGRMAAYAAWRGLHESHELLFKEVQYGQDPPIDALMEFNPDQVYILDFSYKRGEILALMHHYPTAVLDHHKTAAEELADFGEITRDENRCFSGVRIVQDVAGCALAWAFFMPDEELPDLLHYVQDRDLWRFDLEHSKEINAYIETLPFDFSEYDEFYTPLAYDAGKAVLAFQQRQVRMRVEAARLISFYTPAGFMSVPSVNATENASEVGNALCEAYPESPFSITYCDRPDGRRSYSLRSLGYDVSEVARASGGGGHCKAAGFSLPAPDII